jgi:hypothetical protein
LPPRLVLPVRRLAASFAEGITWPCQMWRGVAIVLASIVMKLIAATQFVGAALAFGVNLTPAEYLFLLVFLGFLVIVGHFARVAGAFIVGAIFALSLLGVPEQEALAMALIVQGSSLLSVACFGAIALWLQGVALADFRASGDGAVDVRAG